MQKEQLIASIVKDLEQLPEVYLAGLANLIQVLKSETSTPGSDDLSAYTTDIRQEVDWDSIDQEASENMAKWTALPLTMQEEEDWEPLATLLEQLTP